eukprot:m51a1_g8577 putative gpn-loop gtpase 3 (305) ;mRNA; r:210551-211465
MVKYAQLVMGPAGSGKSTYCEAMARHCGSGGPGRRSVHVVNLDPAAEELRYRASIDVRELVRVEEVMQELGLGPNGGLLYAMEYVVQNIEWLAEELGDYDDDYLLVDCPGQVELYSHIPVMKTLVEALVRADYAVVGLYLVDSHFMTDAAKFISGALTCLSAMVRLEVPHLNVLTKMDLQPRLGPDDPRRRDLEAFLDVDVPAITARLREQTGPRMEALNRAMAELLDDYSMVSFVPLDLGDPASLDALLEQCDTMTQWAENQEPRDPHEDARDAADPGDSHDDADAGDSSCLDQHCGPLDQND